MRLQGVLRHCLAPVLCAALATSAPVAASMLAADPAHGGAHGRWLEVGPRATVMCGLLADAQGRNSHRIEAVLMATSLSGGALYGRLEPVAATDADSDGYLPLRDSELLVVGEYARAADGSGTFDALIVLQITGNGTPFHAVIGAVKGALGPELGQPGVIDPVPLDDAAAVPIEPIDERSTVERLLRTRTVLRKVANQLGWMPLGALEEITARAIAVECKGTFRARWHMR